MSGLASTPDTTDTITTYAFREARGHLPKCLHEPWAKRETPVSIKPVMKGTLLAFGP